jgi:hypothetical protein
LFIIIIRHSSKGLHRYASLFQSVFNTSSSSSSNDYYESNSIFINNEPTVENIQDIVAFAKLRYEYDDDEYDDDEYEYEYDDDEYDDDNEYDDYEYDDDHDDDDLNVMMLLR